MKKNRVGVVLDMAHKSAGYSGIPLDTRWLFSMLSESEEYEVVGIINPRAFSTFSPSKSLVSQAEFLTSGLSGGLKRPTVGMVAKKIVGNRLARGLDLVFHRGLDRRVVPLREEFKNLVWRQFFAGSISSSSRAEILKSEFLLWGGSREQVVFASLTGIGTPKLRGADLDIVIAQDACPFKVDKGTKTVYRYHDAIPILAPDTQPQGNARVHQALVKRAHEGAYWACNSDSSLAELRGLRGNRKTNAYVVPYFVPGKSAGRGSNDAHPTDSDKVDDIFLSRKIEGVGQPNRNRPVASNYILAISTIEPRKNYPFLVKAWRLARETLAKQGKPLPDLVVVGKEGWLFDESVAAMEPYANDGTLHRLAGLDERELGTLIGRASALVSASFHEGFGIPIAEAQMAGIPCVVSDIDAHRYVGADSVVYANPYSVEEFSTSIIKILTDPDLRKRIKTAGRVNSLRFSSDVVSKQWHEFLEMALRERA